MTAPKFDPHYVERGTRVGPYVVRDHVGTGGAGCLYRVERDGRSYALKVGLQRLGDLDSEDRSHLQDRLDREIAALKSCRHPNIVRVHSFDCWPELEDGFPCLVMDFVEGKELYEWRAEGAPSLARISQVFEKIATALDYLHGIGIFHRDLKSQNVLVRADGEPVIVDFGIARSRTAPTVTRCATVGTATHFAPEYARYCDSAAFIRGEPFEWKPTADLHSIGYMLYETLMGKPPFRRSGGSESPTEAAVLLAIKNTIPKRPSERNPGVPPELDEIVLRLLEKDPARRPQSGRELAEALAKAREAGGAAWDQPFDVPSSAVVARREEAAPLPRPPSVPAGGEAPIMDVVDGAGVEPRRPGKARPLDGAVSGAARPVREVAFVAPTEGDGAPPFRDEERAAEEDAASTPDDPLEKALEAAKAQLDASAPRRRPWLLVGGLGAAAAMAMLVVLLITRGGSPVRPKTLLSEVEQTAGSNPVPAALGPAVTPAAPPDTRLGASTSPRSEPSAQPTTRGPGQATSQAAYEHGKQGDGSTTARTGRRSVDRPEVATAITELSLRPSTGAADQPWIQRSRRLPGTTGTEGSAAKTRGVPLGAHLRAKLLSNLDSRTIAAGPVEAILAGPVVFQGRVALPARTLAYGSASEMNGRFTVRFTRLRLPDDSEVAFEAIALGREDGKPGLPASRRVEREPERGSSVAGQIARSTGNILLDTVAGGPAQAIAQSAGRTLLASEDPARNVGGTSALILDAGVVFDIWVERAF